MVEKIRNRDVKQQKAIYRILKNRNEFCQNRINISFWNQKGLIIW